MVPLILSVTPRRTGSAIAAGVAQTSKLKPDPERGMSSRRRALSVPRAGAVVACGGSYTCVGPSRAPLRAVVSTRAVQPVQGRSRLIRRPRPGTMRASCCLPQDGGRWRVWCRLGAVHNTGQRRTGSETAAGVGTTPALKPDQERGNQSPRALSVPACRACRVRWHVLALAWSGTRPNSYPAFTFT